MASSSSENEIEDVPGTGSFDEFGARKDVDSELLPKSEDTEVLSSIKGNAMFQLFDYPFIFGD